jgi:hypothetical protein
MFEKMTSILKWASIPGLIAIALLSYMAGRYEGLLNLTICLSAVFFVQRAAWLKEYGWAAVCVVAVVVFSPLLLVTKIFVLMGVTCVAACLMVAAGFRPQPVATL